LAPCGAVHHLDPVRRAVGPRAAHARAGDGRQEGRRHPSAPRRGRSRPARRRRCRDPRAPRALAGVPRRREGRHVETGSRGRPLRAPEEGEEGEGGERGEEGQVRRESARRPPLQPRADVRRHGAGRGRDALEGGGRSVLAGGALEPARAGAVQGDQVRGTPAAPPSVPPRAHRPCS
jgi:hypothetical protein